VPPRASSAWPRPTATPAWRAACVRALSFGSPRYRTVKTILAKGLDQQAAQTSFDALTETYTRGGRFCRDTKSLLTH